MASSSFQRWVAGVCLLASLCGESALAVEKKQVFTLDELQVTAPREIVRGTLTVPSNVDALKKMHMTPGGVAIVPAERLEETFSINFEDTLALVPGVYATKRFAEEVRISIRGSGLERTFHQKGLNALQDGIPFNKADNSGDFQEIDTLVLQRIEVHKGANAMQFGGTTLGGGINMVSKTGQSNPGHELRLEMGSDDTFRGHIQSGQIFEKGDMFLSLTGSVSDGFRRHADQENVKFNTNIGRKLNANAETRFYFTANNINLELPSTATLSDALSNPEDAPATAFTADQHRDMMSYRISNKTTFDLGDGTLLDVGAFVNYKDLFHPITAFVGVIDQESVEYGLFAEGSGNYQLAGFENKYRMGLTTHIGRTDAKVWSNNGGQPGNVTGNTDQTTQNIVAYGENHLYVVPDVALVTGLQYVWANRRVFDLITPSETDGDYYESFNPKIGALYQYSKEVQLFTNVSKSFEPPDFSDLTQSGTSGFSPVEAQKAWTFEVGTRGEHGRFAWDISLYRAWLENELLKFTVGAGVPSSTFNAKDTIHQGAEIGWSVLAGENMLYAGDRLEWSNSYTYSDFYFDGDKQYGDNDLPGQPPHFYHTELRYDHPQRWFVNLSVDAASSADVDYTNTFTAPGYTIYGVGAGYDMNDKVSFFFDARNLGDKHYISNFSTAVSATSSSSLFYAGDTRRFFGGVQLKF